MGIANEAIRTGTLTTYGTEAAALLPQHIDDCRAAIEALESDGGLTSPD